MPAIDATTEAPAKSRIYRSPGKAIGRIEERPDGTLELVFGNGRRSPVTVNEEMDRELRARIGQTVSLNGINLVEAEGNRTVEVIAHSVNPYRLPTPEEFGAAVKELARVFGPVFADVDPRKFGREDEE